MVISDLRKTTIFTHCIVVISCHQYTKVGDLQAMTAMTLLDDLQNWPFLEDKKYSWNISVSYLCYSEPVLRTPVDPTTHVLTTSSHPCCELFSGLGSKEQW
jgi:hypothetical protein